MKFRFGFVYFICCVTLVNSQNVGFSWAKQISDLYGTTGIGADIQVDAGGNIYCAGRFMNTFDFDPGPGVYTLTTVGNAPFVAKYDNSGNFIWAKHFSNPYTMNWQSGCTSICIDNTGNVFSVGGFRDFLDFDPGPGTFTMNPAQGEMFICKLNSSGNLLWAKQFGRDSSGGPVSVRLDNSGNPVIVGNFQKTNNDFDPGPGVYTLSAAGQSDIFVCKISAAGNLIWVKQIGGPAAYCGASSSTIDNLGNIVTTGIFSLAVDYDPGLTTYTMNSQNGVVFVSVLNSNGTFSSAWQVANVGGAGNSVACDNLGSIVMCGQFGGIADFDPGPGVLTLTASGSFDGVVCKFTSTGSLIWAKQLGGPNYEVAYTTQIDVSGNAYIAGKFQGLIDLDPGLGTYTCASPISPPVLDSYILKLDLNGNFVWGKHFTGPGGVSTNAIALDPLGNVFATGVLSNGSDLDPGPASYIITSLDKDPYILKLSPCTSPPSPTINSMALSSCGPAAFTMSASPTTSITWRTQLMSNTYMSTLSVLNTSTLPVGNYSFYAASSNTCAESFPPALAQVSVFPIPTISIVSSKDIFCLGEPVTLTANGGMNYVMGSTFSSGTFTVWPTPGVTYTITGGDANNCYNSATISLQYDLCTVLKENTSNKNGLQIWPNPGNGEFHIKSQAVIKIEIYNSASELFYFENFKNSPAGPREEISIHPNLAPGIYYFKVFAEGEEVFVRKLVVVD